LRGSGIAVSIIEPGPITTAFGENAAVRAMATLEAKDTPHRAHYEREIKRREVTSLKKAPFALPPEAVARKILRAAESPRPRRRYCVTLPAHFGSLMARIAPAALLDAIMSRQSQAGT
jgi:short-subunit dehydrogenase